MSDLPTNHTTSFHRRFLPYRHFIYLSNSSRHACSRWRRHVPSRSRNDIHRRPIRVREIHHRCALSWAVYSFSQRGQRKPALDEQDVVRYLDPTWVRCHVAGVVQGSMGQGTQVLRRSAHWNWNVALGAVGSSRRVKDVSRGS